MAFRVLLTLFLIAAIPRGGAAQEADLRLAMPQEMLENGFSKHLLPRFGFKTRIKISPTGDAGDADLAFTYEGEAGAVVFQTHAGRPVSLVALSDAPIALEHIESFKNWLSSAPGQAAIEGFPAGGPPLYVVGTVEVEAPQEVVIDGDVAKGSKLALLHCGRCHVVDQRNRMGGIGSSPSFSALRGREGWTDLFLAFWAENPHPSFTQVEGVTEPFSQERPPHIAPIEVTLEEIDAITAFVATIEPKNLGAQVKPR